MHDIFLSYSSQDRERLMPLVSALEQQGWSVFWDHCSIPVGKDWHDVVGDAIRDCHSVVVAWSLHSVESRWVREETLEGRDRNVLFPILLDDIQQPFGFRMLQCANFTHWNQSADHPEFLKLDTEIRRLLGKPNRSRTPASIVTPDLMPVPPEQPPVTSRPPNKRLWLNGLVVALVAVATILLVKQLLPSPSPALSAPQTPPTAVASPPWGDAITSGQANCTLDLCHDPFPHAAPVGSFAANPFGLHDLHGNVWEWVQDNTTKGSQRVAGGGSWANHPGAVRSASRHQHPPEKQHYLLGFRLATD